MKAPYAASGKKAAFNKQTTPLLQGDTWIRPTEEDAPCVVDPFGSPRGFIKWVVPCFFVGLGGYVGSAGLHYASYNFVHQMDAWNASIQHHQGGDIRFEAAILDNYTSNRDPVERWLGPQELIPMGILDKIAMLFPGLFCILMYATQRVEVWTKVMVCTALLAATKGIIGAVTTVPDSSGWEICRDAHLGADGYAWLRQDHTFWEIIRVDFWWILVHGHPLRYCSDMMFSGHTFFVTLYALGLYEVALIWTNSVAPKQVLQKESREPRLHGCSYWVYNKIKGWSPGAKAAFRASVLVFVSVLAIGQQFFEIYFVLLSHFHYTSDVIVALMFTFLFYSNGAISIFAKQWALRDLHFLTAGHCLPKFYLNTNDLGRKQTTRWNSWRMTLCPDKATTRFSLKHWDYESGVPVLTEVKDYWNHCKCVVSKKSHIENPPYLVLRTCPHCNNQVAKDHSTYCRTCGKEFAIDSGLREKAIQNTWVSRGDIFVPICCIPCCCLAGREHVYSDNGVDSFRYLINGDNDPTNDIGDEVVEQMHMHEGISMVDMHTIKNWIRPQKEAEKTYRLSTSEENFMAKASENKSMNPWVFSYQQPVITSFVQECGKNKDFKQELAKVCPNKCCGQLYPDNKEYNYCVTCGKEGKGTQLKPAEKGKTWGSILFPDLTASDSVATDPSDHKPNV